MGCDSSFAQDTKSNRKKKHENCRTCYMEQSQPICVDTSELLIAQLHASISERIRRHKQGNFFLATHFLLSVGYCVIHVTYITTRPGGTG